MFYKSNFLFIHIINTCKKFNSFVTHYNNLVSHFTYFLQHSLFIVRRCFYNCMKCDYQWYFKPVKQWKNIYAILTAIYSKFMFQYTYICATEIDKLHGLQVVALMFLPDCKFYFFWIIKSLFVIVHGYNKPFNQICC